LPFPLRIIRYAKNLIMALFSGKWILLVSQTAYASGFISRLVFSKKSDEKFMSAPHTNH
jgi:hypothetical protein